MSVLDQSWSGMPCSTAAHGACRSWWDCCLAGMCRRCLAAVGIRSGAWHVRRENRLRSLGKLAWMFVGGAFIGFGTRLANGCTSGHGIFECRISISSFVATLTFMTSGILTTQPFCA